MISMLLEDKRSILYEIPFYLKTHTQEKNVEAIILVPVKYLQLCTI